MNRTEKFLKNVVFSGLLSIVTMLVGFILPKIILTYYGSEINGLVSSITQLVGYFTLVEAGLSSASVFALFDPLAKKDTKKINEVVSTTKSFYYKSGLIFLVIVLILSVIYPFMIKTAMVGTLDVFLLVIVIGFTGIIDFFALAKYRSLLTADQKSYVISIATIVQLLIHTSIIVVCSLFKMNIVLIRFIALISVLIRSQILILYTNKNYKNINFNLKPQKKLLSKRWDALYMQILGSFQVSSPYMILTFFSNLINVSVYTIYNMVMMGINNLLSIFISGLSSSFGEIIAKKEQKVLQKSYNDFEYIYYNLLTMIYSVSFVLLLPFIKIYTRNITDANYIDPLISFLFVLNGLLYNIKTPQGMLIHSAGLYKETKIQNTIQGLIILIFGVLLTPKFGVVGILIASILSNIYRTIELLFFIPKTVTKLPIKKTVLRQLKILLLTTIIIVVCSCFNPFSIYSWVKWIVYGLLYIIVSLIIVVVFDFFFEKEMLISIINRFSIMKRRKK